MVSRPSVPAGYKQCLSPLLKVSSCTYCSRGKTFIVLNLFHFLMMKVSFGLTTAALLTSGVYFVSTTGTMTVSKLNDASLRYTPDRHTPEAAGIVTQDHGIRHPLHRNLRLQQASDSTQLLGKGAACDAVNIRTATERMQQLLSDLRNVSNAAMVQLETMESLLQGMEGGGRKIVSSSTPGTMGRQSRTTSISLSGCFTSTSVIAGTTSSISMNIPSPYSNRNTVTHSRSSGTPTFETATKGGSSVPIISPSIHISHDSSQPVKVIPITGSSRTGALAALEQHGVASPEIAPMPTTATQSEPLDILLIGSSTKVSASSQMRSSSGIEGARRSVTISITPSSSVSSFSMESSDILASIQTVARNNADDTVSAAPTPDRGAGSSSLESTVTVIPTETRIITVP